ncbi:MAG TPA: NADPH-dependent glutamate synthase [Bacillota bacterium]|nr:NADPH-dependent glutamate synthase [Bacillota bacterium]HOA15197.1 NADPH-dependent glutamate synthase [Bacillota bacterium]
MPVKDLSARPEMPKQDPAVRRHNFEEVALGLTPEQAINEAKRCLQCRNKPCVAGCPVEVPIPEFLELAAQGKFTEASLKIKQKNSLPAICGRVCPQETQCEEVCTLAKKYKPVAIGMMERFVSDYERAHSQSSAEVRSGKDSPRVAVVGSGPSGLTCAADLALMGYRVDIYESLHETGGVLRYGIPEFRLPKDIVDKEVSYVKDLGVRIITNAVIGMSLTLEDLLGKEGYSAVFVGTGAGLPYFLGIPGENLNGVYSANEFLTRVNLMKAYKFPCYGTPVRIGAKVAVVGAGNVAMDSARTALRLGADEVTIVYRRSRQEMPARFEEIENAEEEGVKLFLLTNPLAIVGDDDGTVKKMVCQRMELGEPDSSGRRRPVPIPNSDFELEADTVVVAIGQGPNPVLTRNTKGLELNKHGHIVVKDEFGTTSMPGVFAGGDIVTGAATVIAAMGAGKLAARAIDRYIASK